jgi:hypothetical protein
MHITGSGIERRSNQPRVDHPDTGDRDNVAFTVETIIPEVT